MNTASKIALLSAQAIPVEPDEADVPEWVHLLPASSGEIQTGDSKGPYHVIDATRLIELSFQDSARLPIDENHSTDLAAPKGQPSPARGWITSMEARDDGIWGQVEWNAAGRELVASRAYRAISPVILHDKAKSILRILRASLVNRPNLRGLAALNQETDDMPFRERLADILGLDADAGDDAFADAVTALQAQSQTALPALQAQLGEIGKALGCADDADAAAVLTAAQSAPGDGDGGDSDTVIAALQSELAGVTTQLNAITEGNARAAAVAFVDGAIRDCRVGVKPMRDRYIAMHMRDAAEAEALIGGLPKLGVSGTTIEPPTPKDGEIALNAEQSQATRLLGIPAADYAKTLKAEEAA